MKTIVRNDYLNRLINLNGTPDIKVVTGGKSSLIKEYMQYLKEHTKNINIIFIDFRDLSFAHLKEYHALHTYVEERYQDGKNNYLFIDEVQMCPNFELAITSLHSKQKYDIYITTSNAFLTNSPLATLLTGRYIEIHVSRINKEVNR